MQSENSKRTWTQQSDKKEHINRLKQQIGAYVWIQALALIAEARAVTELYDLEDKDPGNEEILTGVWIQAIGQLIEALGVSKQLLANDNSSLFAGQRTSITGDWIQSIGASVEAVGGEKSLRDAIRKGQNGLIP